MTGDEARKTIISLWLEKAGDSLKSAEVELKEGHTIFALNRTYYACFYAVSALLYRDGKSFSKHSAVKAEFNRSYVKIGKVEKKWGRFYADIFEKRQEGDYQPIISFDSEDIASHIEKAREFVEVIRSLISKS